MNTQDRTFSMETAPGFLGIGKRTFELWLKDTGVEPDFHEPTGNSRPKAMYTETTLRELLKRKKPNAQLPAATSSQTTADFPAVTEVEEAEVVAESVAPTIAETGLARVDVPAFNGDLAVFVGIIAQAVAQALPQPPEMALHEMEFLTFPQAAKRFNIAEGQLRDAAKIGEIKAVKQGRAGQVRAKDVSEWRNRKFDE